LRETEVRRFFFISLVINKNGGLIGRRPVYSLLVLL